MSAFGDDVEALIGAVSELSAKLDGSAFAPVPKVGSRPATIAGHRAWTAPDASRPGQVSVHRDVLRRVAQNMRAELADLDVAVNALNGIRYGEGISITTASAGLIAGWPTAVAFTANASAAFVGVMGASQQTSTTHEDTSSRLTTSAAAYDQAESDNERAVRSVGTNLYSVTALVASYGSGKPLSAVLGAEPSYPVKTRTVTEFSGAEMSTDAIMEILHGLSPGEVAAAGAAHTRLGTVLDAVAGRLASNAGALAESWSGNAAQAAMGQFQRLYTRTATLAQQALQVGSVLSWLGDEVLPQFVSLPDPRISLTPLALVGAAADGVLGGVRGAAGAPLSHLDGKAQAAANTRAQQYIAKLSNYLVIADQSLPDNIGATLAPATGSVSIGGSALAPATGSGSAPPVVNVASAPSVSAGLIAIHHITTKTSGSATKTTATPIKTTGAALRAPRQPGGAATVPSTLQGTTLPGGRLSMPVVTTPPLGPTPSVPSSVGLTGGLPGPLPPVSRPTDISVGPAAETVDDTPVPNAGSASGEPAGLAAEAIADRAVPNVGPVGIERAGNVAPESAELITGLTDNEVYGLPASSGTPGISTADSPVVGEVIGGQSARLDAAGTPAGADGATASPDDIERSPITGARTARRSDEQWRVREALRQDDLWRSADNVVPPVIGDDG